MGCIGWVSAAVICVGLSDLARAAPAPGVVSAQAVSEAVRTVQTLAARAVADKTVPGIAIAVVFQDKLVWAGGFGVRDTGGGRPVDADTVFQLASVSKPVASTVVAELVGEGRIAWDSHISDLDPDFQLRDPWITREVRIDDLFSHRSGLPDHAGDLLEDMGYSRAEVLARLRYVKGGGPFRAAYAYTNFGLTEAAVAAAKAYGLTWEDAAQVKLYGPLGMTSTSSRDADFLARPDRAAAHVKVNGRWVVGTQRAPQPQSPAGGASSSANDMAKWLRLQLADGMFDGRRIVDAAALDQTHAPQIRSGTNRLTGAPTFYGLGWNVGYDPQGRLRLNHSGGFAMGAATNVYLVPDERLGIVVLVNAAPVGVAEGLAFSFVDQALYGRQTSDWLPLFAGVFADPASMGTVASADYSKPPVPPSPALADDAYVGTYANDYFGDVEITAHGGVLAIVEGPHRTSFPLTHYDRDTFTRETAGENAVGRSGVTFSLGPDGKAASVTVENLNAEGDGVFQRRTRRD
jgi:CubicO group peptidase (beta-lactamase class C family)